MKKEIEKIVAKQKKHLTSEERRSLVSEKAYFLAQQRGFNGNCEMSDWLQAEAIIEHMYGKE